MSWWSNLGPQTYKVVAHVVNLDVTPEVNQDAPAKESVPTTAGATAKQSVPTGAATAAGVETAASERVSAHGSVGPAVKSYVIRLACVNDCSAIAKLELASAQFERRLTPINYTFDELRTLWRKRINSGEFYVLVAEGQVAGITSALSGSGRQSKANYQEAAALAPLRSQMLGFVGLKAPLGQEGFIQAIYIAPPFYHQGLGGALLKAAEKILRQRGCGRVTLYVEPFNRMGQCFYRKAGFYATKQKYRHLDILVKEL